MIVLGTQVLCGNLIGAGERDQINSLFFNSFAFLGILYTLLAVVGVLFRDQLATLLGAKGEVHELLSGYIAGYLPGIPAQAMVVMLMALVSLNNDMKRSYLSAGVVAAGNAIGDILLSGMGLFGIGIVSTLSNVLALCILLPGFFNREKAVHFERVSPTLMSVLRAAFRGSPSLMLTVGLLVKNVLMIRTLSEWAGSTGVACMNVHGSVCGLLGILTGGFGIAYVSLAGIYYGEEDQNSFTRLFGIALRIGEACMIPVVVLIALFSSPISALFFASGTQAWEMGKQMFLLGFLFFPVNMIYSCMLNSYSAKGRMVLVNILTMAEVSLVGVVTALAVPRFGIAAAWLSNTWVDILFVAFLFLYTRIRGK